MTLNSLKPFTPKGAVRGSCATDVQSRHTLIKCSSNFIILMHVKATASWINCHARPPPASDPFPCRIPSRARTLPDADPSTSRIPLCLGCPCVPDPSVCRILLCAGSLHMPDPSLCRILSCAGPFLRRVLFQTGSFQRSDHCLSRILCYTGSVEKPDPPRCRKAVFDPCLRRPLTL